MPGGSLGNLVAGVRLDTSRLQGDVSKAQRSFRSFSKGSIKSVGGITAVLGPLNTALLGVSAALGGLALFRGAADAGIEFGRSMAQVRGIMRATTDEFDMLTEAARRAGETTEFTATQASEALVKLGMTGFNAAEAIGTLPGVLDLATAGQLDFGRTADISTNILQGFGLKVEDTAQLMMNMNRVADVMVGTVTRTNTTMEGLADAMKFVAPVAHALGFDIEETAGLIGKLGDAGLKGGIAGRNLATAMLRAQKAAARFGFESGDLVDVIADLEKQGASTTDIMTLFGLRSSKAVLVIKNSREEIRKLQQGLDGVEGEAKDLAETMRDTVWGAFQRVKAVVESVALDAFAVYGDELQGALLGTINFITKHKGAIMDMADSAADAFEFLVPVIMEVGRTIRTVVGNVIRGFKQFAASSEQDGKSVGDSLKNIGLFLLDAWRVAKFVLEALASLTGASVGFMINAFSRLVDAIRGLPQFMATVGKAIGGIFMAIADVVWTSLQSVGAAGQAIFRILMIVVDVTKEVAAEFVSGVKRLFEPVAGTISNVFDKVEKRTDKFQSKFADMVESLKGLVDGFVTFFKDNFGGVFDAVGELLGKLASKFLRIVDEVGGIFKRLIGEERLNEIKEQLKVISEAFDPVGEAAKKNGKVVKEEMAKIKGALDPVADGVKETGTDLVRVVDVVSSDIADSARRMVDSLGERPDVEGGILSAMATVNKEREAFTSGFDDSIGVLQDFSKAVQGAVVTGDAGGSTKKALDAQVKLLRELVEETGITHQELLKRWAIYAEARERQIRALRFAEELQAVPFEQVEALIAKQLRDMDRDYKELLEKNRETASLMEKIWEEGFAAIGSNMSNVFDRLLKNELVKFSQFFRAIMEEITSAWQKALSDMTADFLSEFLRDKNQGFKQKLLDFGTSLLNALPGVNIGGGAPVSSGTRPPGPGIPQFASGGIVRSPMLAMVGEAGPEIILPLSRLQDEMFIEQLGVSRGRDGDVSQTIIIKDTDPARFRQSQSQIAARAAVSLQRAIIRN